MTLGIYVCICSKTVPYVGSILQYLRTFHISSVRRWDFEPDVRTTRATRGLEVAALPDLYNSEGRLAFGGNGYGVEVPDVRSMDTVSTPRNGRGRDRVFVWTRVLCVDLSIEDEAHIHKE